MEYPSEALLDFVGRGWECRELCLSLVIYMLHMYEWMARIVQGYGNLKTRTNSMIILKIIC